MGGVAKIAIVLHQSSNNRMMHTEATRSKSKAMRMLTQSLSHVQVSRISSQLFIW